jgi:hypothetical protein
LPAITGDDSTEPAPTRQYSFPLRAFQATTNPRAPPACFWQGSSCMYAW